MLPTIVTDRQRSGENLLHGTQQTHFPSPDIRVLTNSIGLDVEVYTGNFTLRWFLRCCALPLGYTIDTWAEGVPGGIIVEDAIHEDEEESGVVFEDVVGEEGSEVKLQVLRRADCPVPTPKLHFLRVRTRLNSHVTVSYSRLRTVSIIRLVS